MVNNGLLMMDIPSGYVNSLLLKPWPSRNSGFSHIFHGDVPVRYVTVYQAGYLLFFTKKKREYNLI